MNVEDPNKRILTRTSQIVLNCVEGKPIDRDECWHALNQVAVELWNCDMIDEEQMESYIDRGEGGDDETLRGILTELNERHNVVDLLS